MTTLGATLSTAEIVVPWVPMFDSSVNVSAAAAGTYVGHGDETEDLLIGAASPATFRATQHYIDPADYAVTGRTMVMRLIASFMQNPTANAGTSVATAGLYPVVPGGATTTWVPTLGTVIANSTAAKTGGTASAESRVVSSTFNAPAADTYMLAVVISVATTAGATKISMRLEYSYT